MAKKSSSDSELSSDHVEAQYTASSSAAERRNRGVTFTPQWIVDLMVGALRPFATESTVIIDVGAGAGRFTLAAAKTIPAARVVAVESDVSLAAQLKRQVANSGLSRRVQVIDEDFLRWGFPKGAGKTIFLGNPPYIRHHSISADDKGWLRSLGSKSGKVFSGLSGLHVYFVLRCLMEAQEGDHLLMILPSEWLETRYGAAVKAMILERCSAARLYMFPHDVQVFEGTMTTSLILHLVVGKQDKLVEAALVSQGMTQFPDTMITVNLPAGSSAQANWLRAAQLAVAPPDAHADSMEDGLELGELFSIHRGQVTGMNSVWIANDETSALIPNRFLIPAVTDAKEILDLQDGLLQSSRTLRRVIDLPTDLSKVMRHERVGVERFLAFAESQGASKTYIATHRRAWWSVGLRPPPSVIMSYMARRPPGFALNLCQARLLNIAHGLYPKLPLTEQQLSRIVSSLNSVPHTAYSRTYAGGLIKIEPGDACKIRIPQLHQLGLARAA